MVAFLSGGWVDVLSRGVVWFDKSDCKQKDKCWEAGERPWVRVLHCWQAGG